MRSSGTVGQGEEHVIAAAVVFIPGDDVALRTSTIGGFFYPCGGFAHVLTNDFGRGKEIPQRVQAHQLHIACRVEKSVGMLDVAAEDKVVAVVGNDAARAALIGRYREADGRLEGLAEQMQRVENQE